MIRIKITKQTSKYKVGETIFLSNNEAFGLIDSGCAVQTKDMTSQEYSTNKLEKKKK